MADEATAEKVETATVLPIVEVAKDKPKPVSTALATVKNTDELPLSEAAKVLMLSGLVRSTETTGNVLAKISLGRNLGLPDIAALTGLTITDKGQILTSATTLQQLIKRTKRYKLRVLQRDDKGSKIEVHEVDPVSGEWEKCGVPVFFGPAEAKRAGLDTKENYRKWPTEMYFARAVASAFRTYCPDCMCGVAMYLPEEIEGSGYKSNVADGGLVEDAEFTVKGKAVRAARSKVPPAEPDTLDRVRKLLGETGSDEQKLLAHYGVASLEELKPDQQLDLEGLLTKKKKAR